MKKSELKSKLEATLEYLKGELAKIRTGRASPVLVQDVKVLAYDTSMSIKELGAISVPEPQVILISPWDRSLLKSIEKALRESDLGINPVTDGEHVRINIPALTEERRKEFTKMVAAKTEECKTSMRNVRQEAMKDIERDFEAKNITEDDKFTLKEEVEDEMKDYVTKAEELGEGKKSTLLEI